VNSSSSPKETIDLSNAPAEIKFKSSNHKSPSQPAIVSIENVVPYVLLLYIFTSRHCRWSDVQQNHRQCDKHGGPLRVADVFLQASPRQVYACGQYTYVLDLGSQVGRQRQELARNLKNAFIRVVIRRCGTAIYN
jgi:hypothetical protein